MNKPLKIVFAGTPDIAQVVLSKLIENKFQVDLVLTKPDSRAGRGKKINQSKVKEYALKHSLEILQPKSLKTDADVVLKLKEIKPDIMIVVAYGLILPQEVLDIPFLGCINVHVSLLPKYRGAAPIQRAILAGEVETGVTIMQMDAGLDTGDILLQEKIKIEEYETSATLHDKLANLGANLLIKYLKDYKKYPPIPQSVIINETITNANLPIVTYAEKIQKFEANIIWSEDAQLIERKIRGFNPFPGAFSYLDNELIKIWDARVIELDAPTILSGTIIKANSDGIVVKCGSNSGLVILELQKSGKTRQDVAQYLRGYPGEITSKIFMSECKNEQ